MPDEELSNVDPLGEPQEGDHVPEGTEAPKAPVTEDSGEENVEATGEVEAPEEGIENPLAALEGTGHESLDDLVKAHDTLKGELTERTTRLTQLEQQLRQALPVLNALRGQQANGKELTADEFLNKFVKDPMATIKEIVTNSQKESLTPINQELRQNRIDTAVNRFKNEYPWLSNEDQLAVEKILEKRGLHNVGDNPAESQVFDALETALAHFVKTDPTAYTAKVKEWKAKEESSLNNAKKAAGVGGKRGSAETGTKKKDIFDEVMELDRDLTETYESA